ncbi:hypothetical protein O6H91_09G078000 [Diphasiastrum complanatum]|uniref:Uncharacterized protein n=2 Tax=Diphasiastrum complanatum TaxID=34168 RepID=A0ACC2CP85_DIPCM|nr:hypothetical protein O6H91_09G055700 [Diphasiastrum complanatum]KAJ7544406.1 hypothetical protein O6H91_09G078000 [Diphasiastrum complanatum]
MDNMDGLLCAEEMVESPWIGETAEFIHCNLAADHSEDDCGFFTEFPVQDDAAIACLLEKELSHIPGKGYVAALHSADVCSARSNAVQWMLKVHRLHRFGPLTITLAVNYLDRYLSKHVLSRSWKAWMIQLLSVACVSLAAKMEELEVPLLQDLQIEGVENIFDARTIQRMELAVLSSLGWRMSSVTAFAYVDFLFHKLALNRDMQKSLLTRVTELVLGTLPEPDFLDFRPSILAVAATGCALEESIPLQAEMHKFNLSNLFPVEKDKLEKCYMRMEELVVDPLCPITSVSNVAGRKSPASPVNVAEFSPTVENLGELERKTLDWPCLGQSYTGQTVLVRSSFATSRKRKISEIFK